jgi:putative heme-binding domain-containing protein
MNQTPSLPGIRSIALSFVMVVGIWLGTLSLMSIPPSTGGINITAGGGTFRDHCGACHIVEKGISTHHGPNLYNFGKLAGRRKPGMSAARYVLESVLDPEAFVASENRRGMPRNLASALSPDELRNVVAYVVSRGAAPDYDELRRLEIPDMRHASAKRTVRLDAMELAERALRQQGQCLQCHSLYRNAEYTVFAPSLFGVGLSDVEQVRESITDPNKLVSPVHHEVNVYLADGRVVSGTLISRTADRLVMVARGKLNERIHVDVPISDVETEDGEPLIVPSGTSPMPTGLDKLLTENELEAILTLIRQLN